MFRSEADIQIFNKRKWQYTTTEPYDDDDNDNDAGMILIFTSLIFYDYLVEEFI